MMQSLRKRKKKKIRKRTKFHTWLDKGGIPISKEIVTKTVFITSLALILVATVSFILFSIQIEDVTLSYILTILLIIWSLGFILIFGLVWLSFYMIIDFRIYKRRIGIELVFPDFLQLTSANIRAGMTIDRALWHSIRPNFGVLAKEMEDVAKTTMSGTDLETALMDFAEKYDSNLLKRSISLLIEGLRAGGEIGELLDKIATNIQESRMMQKEMAASVTTYAIFITFASIVAAPFLLALSSQLIVVISSIASTIDLPASTAATFPLSFSESSVSYSDFKIFATLTLTITSMFSAAIVSIILKGNVRAGLRYIPIFAITATTIYLVLNHALGIALSGIF